MDRAPADRDAGAVRFATVRRALTLRVGAFFAGTARLAADFTVRLPGPRVVARVGAGVVVRRAEVRFAAVARVAAVRAVALRAVTLRAVAARAAVERAAALRAVALRAGDVF